MEPKQTLIYVTLAIAILIVSMIVYAVGARKNRWTIKLNAGQILFFGWFMVYACYRFLGPSEEPGYFEANVDVEADGRGICAVPVAGLYPRDLLILARAGLSAVLFMGLWVMWLKTREFGSNKYAYILGALPLGLTLLVMLSRGVKAPGAAGYRVQ